MQSLQCARAIAALLVVYFHASLEIRYAIGPTAHFFHPFGQSGVDIFFVLSGFIIWTSTADAAYSPGQFYQKRMLRVAPLYWLLTLLAALIAFVAPWALKSTRSDPMHVLASLVFLPWPNPAFPTSSPQSMTPVLVPGWTLNCEIIFYALFGLALFSDRRRRILWMLLIFFVFVMTIETFKTYSAALAFYDPLLICEFLLGILAALALERDLALPPFWAALALVAATIMLIGWDLNRAEPSQFIFSGLPAALGIYSLVSIEKAGKWRQMDGLGRIGDASYSLYLTHVFVLAGMRVFWTAAFRGHDGVIWQFGFVAVAMVLATVVGILTHRWIELPAGNGVKRRLGLGSRQMVGA